MSERVRRGKSRPLYANDTSTPHKKDPGSARGCRGLYSPDGVFVREPERIPYPADRITPARARSFRLRSVASAWAASNTVLFRRVLY